MLTNAMILLERNERNMNLISYRGLLEMAKDSYDFYSPTNLKTYNLEDTLQYELSMLERLDPFTKKHSENVANLVCRICEYLKCKKAFTVYATTCGYLHDIGKLKVPYEILSKPGRLTPEEFEVVKKHTTYGYEMCMKDLKLRPYADGPLYHHEALNGSGYPQGLTKKDIPYVAQIIRVADEYDAIVTKRQYKTHINISETLRDLIKDAQPTEFLKTVALDMLKENYRVGKINSQALRALFKVVIDDIYYEISGVMDYIDYLKDEIKRLQTIQKYDQKRKMAKKEKDENYYAEGMRILLAPGETFDNYAQILGEYTAAIDTREHVKERLYEEIKIVKKLKV